MKYFLNCGRHIPHTVLQEVINLKTKWTLQKEGVDTSTKAIEKQVDDTLKTMKVKKKNVESVEYFYNADEGNVYFVVQMNDGSTIEGKI